MRWPIVLACCVAAGWAYRHTLSVPFLLDDGVTLLANPSITRLWPLNDVLFPPAKIYSAGRPLLNLSFALNHAIGGTAVGGYHAVNLLIHVAAGLLLFGIVRRTLQSPPWTESLRAAATSCAVLVALAWLLHPMQTASVTYISQRAESLMGLWYLLTLYAFIRAAAAGGSRAWWAVSVGACAAGMATKEVMVTAPVLVLLYDRQFLSGSFREAWRRHSRAYLALGATWGILIALLSMSRLSARGVGLGLGFASLDYLRIECGAIVRYLSLAVWPHGFVFDYGPELSVPPWYIWLPAAALLLTIVAGAGWALAKRHPLGFAGVAFFLLLSPTSSVVPVVGQPIAENRIYLPLACLIAAAVIGAVAAMGRRAGIVVIGGVVALGLLARSRNEVFQSDLRIWQDTVAKRPNNSRAWTYLAMALDARGRNQEAIAALRSAIVYSPGQAEVHNNLGVFLFRAGDAEGALRHLRTALRLKPDYVNAYDSLGRILLETKDYRGAIDAFRELVRLDPQDARAHNFLGAALFNTGQVAAAREQFETALRLKPDLPEAQANAAALRNAGR